jgi:hypothetical protein
LNPLIAGVQLPDGVVWANGGANQGVATNSVQIYTAAEISFNTQVGTTYQLQAIAALGSGWVNIGDPIVGNGQAYSYVTPTRNNGQQYFRVAHTP